jgi:hypothetical protein
MGVGLEMAVALKWSPPPFMVKQFVSKGINDQLNVIKRLAESSWLRRTVWQ